MDMADATALISDLTHQLLETSPGRQGEVQLPARRLLTLVCCRASGLKMTPPTQGILLSFLLSLAFSPPPLLLLFFVHHTWQLIVLLSLPESPASALEEEAAANRRDLLGKATLVGGDLLLSSQAG